MMAVTEKKKKNQVDDLRDAFLSFNSRQQPQPQSASTGLEPQLFGEQAPVERPDVPAIEEELPQQAKDDSILGSFLNVMDNIVPDDMGGMIRGTSGWLSNVPLYKETVGSVLGVPLSAGETAIDVMNWGSEQMNHLGAALMSALPGGIQTLDWEQSQNISLGQVVAANAAINSRNGAAGFLINVATSLPFAALNQVGQAQDPTNILYSENFDILNEEDRKAAFESGGMGQFSSGFADAVWLVAADPTIIGGKFTNIIRLGTKVGEFGGLTNQALRTSNQVRDWASTVQNNAKLIDELGIDGARASGRLDAQGEYLINVLESNADELVAHPWVRSSGNKRDLRALLGATSVDDPMSAGYLAGALAGDAASWNYLRQTNVSMYDSAAQALGVDVFAPVGSNVDDLITAGVKLTDDQIAIGDDLVYEVLSKRPELIAAGQMITRGGSRIGPRSVRAKNAWRTGATRNQFENNAFKKSPVTETSNRGHFVYETIEDIAGSRPVQVIRWLGKGTPNGIVFLKDGADGQASLDEISAWLTKSPLDQATSARYLNEYAAARTVKDRLAVIESMENSVVGSIAAENGLTNKAAIKLYDDYRARRAAALDTIRKSETKFYIDPDTNKAIKVPDFYAELDQAFPLLDVRYLRDAIKNSSVLRGRDDILNVLDYANSIWKVSVLLRLGYTQRNLAEGVMRSFAVLGLVAANPMAFLRLPGNAIYYAKARRAIKGARTQEKRLMDTYRDLTDARNVLNSTLGDARVPQMEALEKRMKSIYEEIVKLEKSTPNLPGVKRPAATVRRIEKLKRDYNKARDKHSKIKIEHYEPLLPKITEMRAAEDAILKEIDDLSSKVLNATELARAAAGKRKLTGRRANIMDDGIEMPGAFQGQDGAIALLASSADRTTYMTFDSAVGRRIEQLENSADFKRLDPSKLKPEQMQTYFDEYALRVNRRYREDPVGKMILENRPIDDIRKFLSSPAGKGYREQLSVKRRPIRNQQDIDEYIDHMIRRLDNEMPRDTKLRELALDHEVTPAEVAAALNGRELPVIVGRLEDGVSKSDIFKKTKRGIDRFTEIAMRALGTIPENKMLRHPFYSSVFDAEQRRLYNLAADQGVDVMLPLVQNRINKSAHSFALKATRETLYTIDRLSNAAQMLRFVSPFFPAWENSIKTWGRIVWDNPAIAGYGNLFWNIPNNLGLVVNENGETVEKSNMLKDEGNYIVWPAAISDFLKKDLGPFSGLLPGQELRSRQQSFNVILPGSEWWFAGLGPSATIPTALFLRGKPEDAEVLKSIVGEEMFQQIVPSANPQADLLDAMLPTVARRYKQMFNGASTNSAYISTYNQIIEDEYIKAQLEGRALTEADMRNIKNKAERYWRWQIGAAGILPVQTSIVSEFQPQRDYWNKLIDNDALTYDQKLKALQDKFPEFGDSLLAITRSGSYTETKLRPNLTTWKRITKNPELVNKLYNINPELVGMFGNMGSFDDPFSYAVYGEFGNMEMGPDGKKVRRKLTPDEVVTNNEIIDGWNSWWQIKDYVEDKAIELGYSSIQVKEAQFLRDILDNARVDIAKRYPAWLNEQDSYETKLPDFIRGSRILVENAELINEDSTIATLSDYLTIREYVSNALQNETNDDKREELRQLGYAAAFELRQRDIGFADFYDQYLDRDDFRKVL